MNTENRKVKVVLDTNVFISGLNFPGNERKILILFLKEQIEVYISDFIVEEIKGILRVKFQWQTAAINGVSNKIKGRAIIVRPKTGVSVIKAKDSDNRILECAMVAQVDYIVSGDTKHIQPLKQFQSIPILSPSDFLSQIVNI